MNEDVVQLPRLFRSNFSALGRSHVHKAVSILFKSSFFKRWKVYLDTFVHSCCIRTATQRTPRSVHDTRWSASPWLQIKPVSIKGGMGMSWFCVLFYFFCIERFNLCRWPIILSWASTISTARIPRFWIWIFLFVSGGSQTKRTMH